jgi:DNA-3-methyladenine glycosylase I
LNDHQFTLRIAEDHVEHIDTGSPAQNDVAQPRNLEGLVNLIEKLQKEFGLDMTDDQEISGEDRAVLSDQDYYWRMVKVVFCSGLRVATVDKFIEAIRGHFSEYTRVAGYDAEHLAEIGKDPKMIKNKSKIQACYKNAVKFEELIAEYGSIHAYIHSFAPASSDLQLLELKKSLEYHFSFIGNLTVLHYLQEIGFDILIPDKAIMRVFTRLGLVGDDMDYWGAFMASRAINSVYPLPMRHVANIFSFLGQTYQDKNEEFCTERDPKCHRCWILTMCEYAKKYGNMTGDP